MICSLIYTSYCSPITKKDWILLIKAKSFLCKCKLKWGDTFQPELKDVLSIIWMWKLASASEKPVTYQGSKGTVLVFKLTLSLPVETDSDKVDTKSDLGAQNPEWLLLKLLI